MVARRLDPRTLLFFSLALLAALATPGHAVSEEMPVPPPMQAQLFKKIFAYDKKLSTAPTVKVVVAFVDSTASAKDALVKAFKEAEIPVQAMKADQVAANLGDASVIYVTGAAAAVRSICQKNQVLSITGIPSLVEAGNVSIGLSVAESKPKILVHMGELKAEGHEVSAKLLQLAKIID